MMKNSIVMMAFLALAFLAGCVEGPPPGAPPGLTFENVQPIGINASSIEIRNEYKPLLQEPHVEHTFTVPPYVAAENLVRKQLAPAGGENVLRVIIEDASVVREKLPADAGLIGQFTRQPSEQLNARVLLRYELYNPSAPDIIIGRAQVVAKRSRTLMENASLADRDRAYFALTEALMADLADGMRGIVKNTFGHRP